MPEYGDVIYNITDMYVAQLQSDNSYGTPSQIVYGQQLSWEYESDNDEIKSYGLIVESLSIPIKATGTFMQAAMDFASFAILTSFSGSESGTTPNQVNTLDIQVGGSGLPYFGICAAFAAPSGANMIAGFPKCKLSTVPGFTIEQNTFRTSEVGIEMFAPSTSVRKVSRYKRYETAGSIPSDASAFDTYFNGMF